MRSISFGVSGSPGLYKGPANEDLPDVEGETEEEDQSPDQDEGLAQHEVLSWLAVESLPQRVGVVEDSHHYGDNAGDGNRDLEQLQLPLLTSLWQRLLARWLVVRGGGRKRGVEASLREGASLNPQPFLYEWNM